MRHSIPEKRDMPNEQIPLSEEGKALALSKSNVLSNVDRCFSSPYRRAVETAELIVDHPFIVEELHETGETPVVQEEEQVDVCAEGIPSSFPPT